MSDGNEFSISNGETIGVYYQYENGDVWVGSYEPGELEEENKRLRRNITEQQKYIRELENEYICLLNAYLSHLRKEE